MQTTRRHFLTGTFAILTTSVRPTFAVEPATVAAIIAASASVISSTLDFLKKAGDFELELQALHVKLDQILRNQLIIMEAISDLAANVQLILEKVDHLPVEVVSALFLTE